MVPSTIDHGSWIPAPATPPVLSKLLAAHSIFVTRKRKEREAFLEWCILEAEEVDKRARARSHYDWLISAAEEVDALADASSSTSDLD